MPPRLNTHFEARHERAKRSLAADADTHLSGDQLVHFFFSLLVQAPLTAQLYLVYTSRVHCFPVTYFAANLSLCSSALSTLF